MPVHNIQFVYFFLINSFYYLIIKLKERSCLFIALSKQSFGIIPFFKTHILRFILIKKKMCFQITIRNKNRNSIKNILITHGNF